ncbi:protein translocase subunit SecDF [Bartonella henselae]|uniref:Multifunctional fusion protein n=1 Tax=Bartonella henselae (strain ATCC 49882 / DSM 28221 / CCUG 30454 / Houston 1) TaxID=283166 RepID=A0A0H3M3P0_BARHE|nr:protein translocase subunit SecD [Bartonella henselae]ATP12578.1 protein translocase subunit SecDF [Bartonella henselae]ETS08193.1 protein-export membrane protein SecD [Bartonella henselae JK 50]ETS08741.1 protein-export membrane protein SecD [Bartonella henselae JK 51]MDM9990344.1 protein translocase subunit SecD [Bartonella henselae]OLL38552.1 preprotein translocase subunit SecD [Bartonella henselae]
MRTPGWLITLYCFILLSSIYVALPNLFSQEQVKNSKFLTDTRVTLGLDLQGGSSLLLEVDTKTLKRDQLHMVLGNVRNILREKQIRTSSVRVLEDSVIALISDPTESEKAVSALKTLITPIHSSFGTTADDITISAQDKTIRVMLTEAGIKERISNAIEQSLEIIRRRIDQVGVTEPAIQKVGTDRIMVQLPGLQDPKQLRDLLGTTAKMTFHLVPSNVDINNLPTGVSILPGYTDETQRYAIYDQIALDGNVLKDARAGFDPQMPGRSIISFTMNSTGSKIFADITRQNINRPFAIVLDNKVLTAPTINSVIPNGQGQITGNFDPKEASTLAALLRAGSLPAPLTVIEERTVGPNLGADAIQMGLYTGIIGFVFVTVFIFLLYGVWGIIANIALALHTILTFAALSLLGATLTLPGIAGIILGIGIAVDANILINERIREESRKGISAFAALDRGFKQAFATIIDANVTAIIATILLFWFGTGPVRGFAVTMLLGIIISMFTNITIVRIMMIWVVRKWKIKALHLHSVFNIIPRNTTFHFMKARFIGIGVSIVLSLASIFLFFKPGLNFGIDFIGGSQMSITTKAPANLTTLRSQLSTLNIGEVTLQNMDNANTVLIRIQKQSGGEIQQTTAIDKVKTTVHNIYPNATFDQIEVVGPKISGELATAAFTAVILAAIAMSLYIWLRFEWFFAVGAIVTLILDTTKMIGFFALFQFDFNLTAIAALLTIVGYSINDKVVVYDRMRENMRLYKKMSLRELIDLSINQVLIRCLFTSATTVLAMLPMALWGGSAVYNFAFPMVFGIIIATSSSIFIAAPILLLLGNWWRKRNNHTNTTLQ